MKKIVPILLAVALALALCLVGFADAERYDDDPLEETAVPTSEAVLEETGPFETKCIHSIRGTDEVYRQNATYYQVCGSCGYKSDAWTVDEGETLRYCHGWTTTKH